MSSRCDRTQLFELRNQISQLKDTCDSLASNRSVHQLRDLFNLATEGHFLQNCRIPQIMDYPETWRYQYELNTV
jgi:hypothetical protein